MNNYLFWKRFAQGKLKTHVSSVKIRVPSPKEILSWSERRLPNSTLVGKIDNAHTVEHDTLRPVSGGLFCERIFGPIATNVCACLRRKGWNEDYCKVCEVQFTKSRLRRYQMGHILLAAPVIHIWALQGGYLASLLGKKNLGIRSIAYGKVMCQSKLWTNYTTMNLPLFASESLLTLPCLKSKISYRRQTMKHPISSPTPKVSALPMPMKSSMHCRRQTMLDDAYAEGKGIEDFTARASSSCRRQTTRTAAWARAKKSSIPMPKVMNQRFTPSSSLASKSKISSYLPSANLSALFETNLKSSMPMNLPLFTSESLLTLLMNQPMAKALPSPMTARTIPSATRSVSSSTLPSMKSSMPMLEDAEGIEDFTARASSNAEGKSKSSPASESIFDPFFTSLPTMKSKVSATTFLSHTGIFSKNKTWFVKKEKINYQIQKIYERGNVLPFHQFILYKPDGFDKIIQFFNSLDKEKINFPLPHYSKQQVKLVNTRRDQKSRHTQHIQSPVLGSRPSQGLMWPTKAISDQIIGNHVYTDDASINIFTAGKSKNKPLTINPFVTLLMQAFACKPKARATSMNLPLAMREDALPMPMPMKSSMATPKVSASSSCLKSKISYRRQTTRSVAWAKGRAIACIKRHTTSSSMRSVPWAWKSSMPSTLRVVPSSLPKVNLITFFDLSSATQGNKISNSPVTTVEALKGVNNETYDFKLIPTFSLNTAAINLAKSTQKDTIRNFGVFNQFDILNWGIFYFYKKPLFSMPINLSTSFVSANTINLLTRKMSVDLYTPPTPSHRKRPPATASPLLGTCLPLFLLIPSKIRNKQTLMKPNISSSYTQVKQIKLVYRKQNLSQLSEKGNGMVEIFDFVAVGSFMQAIAHAHAFGKGKGKGMGMGKGKGKGKATHGNIIQKIVNKQKDRGKLTDVKNIAYTGSSVLFQTLKNLNLVLLNSLINWKWKKAKTQLSSFLLQNKLTKKKRNLRNKLAKIKIILTKRKNLVQSFLNTKQLPEWMVLSILPVLPPALRPILELEPNNVVVSDLNVLYQTVIRRNDALMGLLTFRALEIDILNRQVSLQQAIEKLFDKGAGTKKRPVKSLSQGFHGKKGLFRSHLLGKRVDYSGRSVIVVGPQLKLHECGLPKEMALVLFLPFLIARLKKRKIVNNTSQAKQLIVNKDKQIWRHLKSLIYEHPVLLNRAPTLHRLGFQAFQPILVSGKAMILPALVCTGFNADFDGDQMAVHVPLSHVARAESWKLLHARNNMLSPATGKPIIVLSQEMILGCYCSSLILNKTFVSQLRVTKSNSLHHLNNFSIKMFANKSLLTMPINLPLFASESLLTPPCLKSKISYRRQAMISSSALPSMKSPMPMLEDAEGIEDFTARASSNAEGKSKSSASPSSSISMNLLFPCNARRRRQCLDRKSLQQHLKSQRKFNKHKKSFYFATFQEIYKALAEDKIAIQTAIWLRIPFFEDNQSLEQPLEIRLDATGHFFRSYCQSQRHFSKNIKSRDQIKGISYIRTSAGRIQLNETFYSSLSQ